MRKMRRYHDYLIEKLSDRERAISYLQTALEEYEKDPDGAALYYGFSAAVEAQGGVQKFALKTHSTPQAVSDALLSKDEIQIAELLKKQVLARRGEDKDIAQNEPLPKGWRGVRLADACEIIVSPVDKKTVDGELPVKLCNYTDVYYNNTIDSKIDFMAATAKPREIEKFSIVTDDVIITKDSETPDDIGVPAYVKETADNLLCGYHLTILRPKRHTTGKYVCYALTAPKVKYDFYRFANGITRFGLTNESYQKIKIPLPPLSEQKAIASLLEKWDTAIEKIEALIEAKKKRFKWLLKTFINDQQDNPEWQQVKLAEVGVIHSGGTPSTRDSSYWNGDIPWLTPSEVTRLSKKYINSTERQITRKGLSRTTLLPENCLIVCTRATIGNCCINTVPMAINQGFKCIQPHRRYSVTFLYYAFLLLKTRLIKLSCGNTFGEVSKKDFANILISIPPFFEQKTIAAHLDTAQQEIYLLKQLAEQYRTQKHGLMQKLLTGEWRVKEEKISCRT